jgi:sugar phosphate isomerase/epimerase
LSGLIRHPLALRLDPAQPAREQIHEAAKLGAKGVVLDAIGDLAPHRLGATGRRDLRHVLRTVELSLTAVALPTRRPFDTVEQLDDRIKRAEAACAMAHELDTTIVLVRAGGVPPPEDPARLEVFTNALQELARRADHHGVRLALETGAEAGAKLKSFLKGLVPPCPAASIDPAALLQAGIDPVAAARELGSHVVHAYASDAALAAGVTAVNPRGFGFPPGALDWEEYLGALEEIEYRGFLTIWPAPGASAASQFTALVNRLKIT